MTSLQSASGAFPLRAPFSRSAVPALSRLHRLGRIMRVAKDDTAMLDETREKLIFLAVGATKLVAHASANREQIVAFHFAGELVTVPQRREHSYSLCALAESELLVFDYGEILASVRDEPEMLGFLLDQSRRSLARCREKTIALGRKSAPERIATLLVAMAERIGSDKGHAVLLDLPMSRRDIADSVGLTIETVSRQLTSLRDEGLIDTHGRSRIWLFDLAALKARAGYFHQEDEKLGPI